MKLYEKGPGVAITWLLCGVTQSADLLIEQQRHPPAKPGYLGWYIYS